VPTHRGFAFVLLIRAYLGKPRAACRQLLKLADLLVNLAGFRSSPGVAVLDLSACHGHHLYQLGAAFRPPVFREGLGDLFPQNVLPRDLVLAQVVVDGLDGGADPAPVSPGRPRVRVRLVFLAERGYLAAAFAVDFAEDQVACDGAD
jgi:hypothetical protein